MPFYALNLITTTLQVFSGGNTVKQYNENNSLLYSLIVRPPSRKCPLTFFSSVKKIHYTYGKCPHTGKLNRQFGKGRWKTAEVMNDAIADAEVLDDFGDTY